MSKATVDQLGVLHELVATFLTTRIRSGEASAADVANALKMLKDNGIEANAVPGSPLANLAASLPFPVVPAEDPLMQ